MKSLFRHTRRAPILVQRLGSALGSTLPITTTNCRLVDCSAATENSPATAPDKDKMTEQKPLAPPGMSVTFYKRELPCPPAVAFSSDEGQAIFRDALMAGTMQGFFRLIEQFRTQDEPAYCGLASVSMVLNALSIDPRRAWKGPWRFFHEQMLDCCHPLEKVRMEGITLEQAGCLARCNGAAVDVYPYGSVSLENFREMVRHAASTSEYHLIVSYTRKAFLQTGDGHFSPIGGYSPERDMVLILDTARFKYPPHWVRLEELYEAMESIDPATGLSRGFMKLGLPPLQDSVLFTLDVRDKAWEDAFAFASGGVAAAAAAAASKPGASAADVISAAMAAAPSLAVKKFLAVRMATNSCHGGVCTQIAAIETFLNELRSLPLYRIIKQAVPLSSVESAQDDNEMTAETIAQDGETDDGASNGDICSNTNAGEGTSSFSIRPAVAESLQHERLTMLLLLVPQSWWDVIINEGLRKEVKGLLDISSRKVVACELRYLAEQYKELPSVQKALETPACATCGTAEVPVAVYRETDGGGGSSAMQQQAAGA